MTEGAPLLELRGVDVAYPNGRSALAGVDLTIRRGERVVLLGTNGCGKSTLLRVLDALITPTVGEFRFEERRVDVRTAQDRAWQQDFRRRVVLMFQHPEAMLFNPTVREEIAFGLRHLPDPDREVRVRAWADRLRLSGFLDMPPFELSGGEKQRLCLACLLAVEPEVLLLDEPTANLDPRTVGWLLQWLRERSITSVVATHQMAQVPQLGDRIVILSERHRVVYDSLGAGGPPDRDLLVAQGLAHAP
ncbi:Sulfate and thiosulfate import ATP-binding protein CysA [Thioalkalivibrio nitratireducens DSM 14787]|uniref:Sulfate and thiosulfate import ATP-binding protein CysA n=1 Tax=Thioalkalivibrio nitratireducens (strain DSM 14787 / UNIQEM 213 / ALEN2) TaxID=1255043 RepID=L0DTR2_THIND|nr:ABC transporter ATP-binding protein [Thioalkalivibrio nitratireducens]AGA32994.1 Sulfate and thiosulfate import ATP-binding protein CysA [Thioalkalivibrio nitratireducens DSM 14787]